MAGVAGRAQSRILIVDVAGQAGHRRVFPGQWEPRRIVIKGGAGPIQRAVAKRAILRESRRDVIRIRGGLVLLQMA